MHTTFSAIANMGLLKNQGFAVSANLIAQTATFSNLDITQASQGCLTSVGGQTTAVQQALKNVPGFLTGIIGNISSYTDNITVINNLNTDNIISNISVHANTVFGTGAGKFVGVLNRTKSFVESSYDSYITAYALSHTNINNFGFTINNYTDILTVGISSQFNLVGGLGNQSFVDFARQLKNIGTLFDINNLNLIDQPYVLCLNLLNQGFNSISDVLIAQSIDINAIDIVDKNKILSALKNIVGTDLSDIINGTGFKPQLNLTSLADVFDIKYILTTAATRVAGGSLSSLANKFLNIGGKFESFNDLSDFLLNLKYNVNVEVFDQLTDFNSIVSDISILAGSGSGIYGNPTVDDVIGSVGGSRYNDLISSINNFQNLIINTTQGQALKDAILSAYTLDINDSSGINAANIIIQRTNELNDALPSTVNAGILKFSELVSKFIIEIQNYQLIKFDLEDIVTNVDTVNTFTKELVNVNQDPKQLGYANYIKNVVDTTIYGSSIMAAVIEGTNIHAAQQRNLQIPNRISGT